MPDNFQEQVLTETYELRGYAVLRGLRFPRPGRGADEADLICIGPADVLWIEVGTPTSSNDAKAETINRKFRNNEADVRAHPTVAAFLGASFPLRRICAAGKGSFVDALDDGIEFIDIREHGLADLCRESIRVYLGDSAGTRNRVIPETFPLHRMVQMVDWASRPPPRERGASGSPADIADQLM